MYFDVKWGPGASGGGANLVRPVASPSELTRPRLQDVSKMAPRGLQDGSKASPRCLQGVSQTSPRWLTDVSLDSKKRYLLNKE